MFFGNTLMLATSVEEPRINCKYPINKCVKFDNKTEMNE